ncbi:MAG: tetratricopeptide repeat protein [Candidatus Heimdallarchaeota archaeon]|nr:tetratricopeptide repeat protein [Candidatus Heimdallarchaeota archaeon]
MTFVETVLRLVFRKPDAPLIENMSLLENKLFEGDMDFVITEVERICKGECTEFEKLLISSIRARAKVELRDMDGLEESLDETISKSNEISHPIPVLFAKAEKGNLYYRQGKMNEGLELLENLANEVAATRKFYSYYSKKIDARLQNLLGKMYVRTGEVPKAIDSINSSIQIYAELDEATASAEAYNDLGIAYATKGDFEGAVSNLNESIAIYDRLDNQLQLLKINNNLGMIYWRLGSFDEALSAFENALASSKEIGADAYFGPISLNIGLIYQDKGDVEKAFETFNQCLADFKKKDDKPNLATTLLNLGNLQQLVGDYTKAIFTMNDAAKIFKELDDKSNLATIYGNIGGVHLQREKYKDALGFFEKSIALAEDIGPHLLMDPLASSIEALVALDEMDQAKENLKKLKNVKDEMNLRAIDKLYDYANAQILLKSSRVVQRAEAQKILNEMANDTEGIDQSFTTNAMLLLGGLLLEELKASPSEEALTEFKNLIDKLDKVARGGETALDQIPNVIKILLLRSKLAIIDLNIDEAQKILDEAHDLASKKRLSIFTKQIEGERENIKNQMMKYKSMVEENASLYERLQQSQIENYLSRAEAILKMGKKKE